MSSSDPTSHAAPLRENRCTGTPPADRGRNRYWIARASRERIDTDCDADSDPDQSRSHLRRGSFGAAPGRSLTAGRRLAGIQVLLLALLAACNPPIKQYELKDQPLTCNDANRFAYRTIEAMRFKVSDFHPGAPGQPGVIKASRTVSGSGGGTQSVTVTIDCTPTGADIDASEDGAWLNQIDFKRAFQHAFLNIVSMRAAEQQLDQENLAGTAPASQQRRDLKVVVAPQRGQAAKLDFPFDLAAAGVLPVRFAITNLTSRTYSLDVAAIRLTRRDGERVTALSPRDAAARITATADGAAGQPATPDAVADALSVRQLAATEIGPGVEREGFLYFALGDYVGARVVLTDKETGEDEGVRVEF